MNNRDLLRQIDRELVEARASMDFWRKQVGAPDELWLEGRLITQFGPIHGKADN